MNSGKHYILITVLISLVKLCKSEESPIVFTHYGHVVGLREKSPFNTSVEYYSFYGIRYARPPVGELRFREALPPIWELLTNATTRPPKCTQLEGKVVMGSEDCLYLNILAPVKDFQKGSLPVMVWIHGGNFVFGKPAHGYHLMEKPVIYVGLQYRLNVFGFLSTMDHHALGNFALKDQTLALQWLKDNIEFFGGDANRVTIFGESAGGASVQHHLLSNRSAGLFHRAISQSGSVLNPWSYQQQPLEMTLRLARGLGIQDTNTKTIVQRLQKVPADVLLLTAYDYNVMGYFTPYGPQPFTSIIEIDHPSAFISRNPMDIMREGSFNRVPYMAGYNTEEGSWAYQYIADSTIDIKMFDQHPEMLLPPYMNLKTNSSCYYKVLDEIKKFYFKGVPFSHPKSLSDYFSHLLFISGIRKSEELIANHQIPLYYYVFTYTGGVPSNFFGGVAHHQEVQFIVNYYPEGAQQTTLYRQRMVELWTNFAETGNPTPHATELLQNVKWSTFKQGKRRAALDFGDNLSVIFDPDQKDYLFWERLGSTCGTAMVKMSLMLIGVLSFVCMLSQ